MIFGIMSGVKMLFFGAIAAAVIGGFVYVKGLQKDLAVAKENMIKMEQAHKAQQKVIEQQKIDFQTIVDTNKQINDTNKQLLKEFSELDKKFNKINASGKKRDIGQIAVKRAESMERIVNRGSKQAVRCVEVAMGDPLTEKEKNATKKSQINPICPDLVNPSYVNY
jgi:glutamate synthase domain-containing protein 3